MNIAVFTAYYVLGMTWQIDKICDDFDLDLSDKDVESVIKLCFPDHLKSVGNVIVGDLYQQIITRAVNELGLEEDKFDARPDGACSSLAYEDQDVQSWDELVQVAKKSKKA